jgi:hypothetical protein
MSIGNLKDSGNLNGNNFPWQLKMLLGQQCACDQLTTLVDQTDDVEFLLTSILTTLQASTEYEAKFVVDTCNGDTVYLEVRVWNPDTSDWGPITYYLPGSATPVIPPGASTPGCLKYTDPSAVLALILGAIQAGNLILQDIDNNTDGLESTLNVIAGAIKSEDAAHVSGDSGAFVLAVRNDLNTNMTSANGDYSPVAVNANGAVAIQDGGGSITVDGGTGSQRTPTFLRPSGTNGTVGPNIYSASFASVGTANAIVGGIILKPGETLNFDAGAINNTLAAISYNTSTNPGAELIITTLI